MSNIDNFKKELHDLLTKYNASISCLIDGDTHIKAQIDRKDELEALINSQDITIEELEFIEW